MNAGAIGYRDGPLMAASDRFKHRGQGPADARLAALGRRRPDRHGRRRSCIGAADDREPAGRHHRVPGRRLGRRDQGRHPQQHHPGVRSRWSARSARSTRPCASRSSRASSALSSQIAAAAGATTEFELGGDPNPVVVNDPALTARAVLPRCSVPQDADNVVVMPVRHRRRKISRITGRECRPFFYIVGVTPQGQDAAAAPSNHSPLFFIDEAALPVGGAHDARRAVDYLQGAQPN